MRGGGEVRRTSRERANGALHRRKNGERRRSARCRTPARGKLQDRQTPAEHCGVHEEAAQAGAARGTPAGQSALPKGARPYKTQGVPSADPARRTQRIRPRAPARRTTKRTRKAANDRSSAPQRAAASQEAAEAAETQTAAVQLGQGRPERTAAWPRARTAPRHPAWIAQAILHLPRKAPLPPRLRTARRRRPAAIGRGRPNFGAWSRGA